MTRFKRILLKLSGEALMADMPSGIDTARLMEYTKQVKEAAATGVKIGIVIGGGNIFRGLKGVDKGFDRIKGDYMGMLATVINGLAIQSALESIGAKARLLTAINMDPVGERYSKQKLEEAFDKNEIVIFAFGTGNPFFTTDTASSLRAVEMNADVLLKGTRVDGIYTADPEKDPHATKFDDITFDEAYKRGLSVMDLTSITMCKENNLPIIVFDMNKDGNLLKLVNGEKIGTLVHN
jgi:uridylate kinase